jgi:hypothetical protein
MGDRTEEREREAPKAQRFEELWLGLARAALGGESLDGALEDPKRLAESIDRHLSRERYDQAILSYLRQIIGELGDGAMRCGATALPSRASSPRQTSAATAANRSGSCRSASPATRSVQP